MIKRMVIMLLAVGLLFGGIFGFQAFKAAKIKEYMAAAGAPAQTVTAAQAVTQTWQSHVSAVGSLRAANGADLAFEVSGIVDKIAFNSGDEVKAGQLLINLSDADDVAKLEALQATADLAKITYDRDVKQLKIQAVSQATVDTDQANLKSALAQVAQQQAVVDKKVMRAPFAGKLGIRSVDVGQYLNAGTTVVTLQALDPIFVDFFLPQQALDQIQVNQNVTVRVDAFPNITFVGQVAAINSRVDTGTRNVQVRATLRNPDHKLLPGMYATVEVDTGKAQQYVTLPQTAIVYNSYGANVYIVDKQGKDEKGQDKLVARQTFVSAGPTRGDQVAILKGVKEGETVVTAGQVKLRNGVSLVIDNSVAPTNDANPRPADQ